MRILCTLALVALSACASLDDRPDTVTVRGGAGSDVIAERMCGSPVVVERAEYGSVYVVYRCVRDAQ